MGCHLSSWIRSFFVADQYDIVDDTMVIRVRDCEDSECSQYVGFRVDANMRQIVDGAGGRWVWVPESEWNEWSGSK
jgi:hypothetical protein